jgi:hypothetical protein
MAVSHVATGDYGENTAATYSYPLAGGLQGSDGDRVVLLAAWKTFSITATVAADSGATPWTEVTEFTDGAVASGNGLGSMKIGAWYFDRGASTPGDPTITFSSAPAISGVWIHLISKSAGDSWNAPAFVTAAWPVTATTQTISASSTVLVPNDSLVWAGIALRDDSAAFTRAATTGIDVASGITWNGNYVETPSVHYTTTTGSDMSADSGYRLVTTGGTVTLRVTATISAVETGAILWLVHSATTPPPRVPYVNRMPQLLAH